MFTFLLILQSLVAAAMVTVILMQRSEGGGLGVGGSPSGLMSARGAADFLTRATAILATVFIILSIALAGLATLERAPMKIDPSLTKTVPRNAPINPGADPLAIPPAAPPATKAPATSNGAVPLAQ
ncbi:MAG TPA: preprotein translocase subunit SecG [Allosphingosinicella sp.]|jgi:preprotein translocase subunit SecG|nr:preprotein translocase subunit SecG [Allosphingosinicella sp.]